MFWHIFKYRFLSMLKQKEIVFWNALFPILLCTCFVIAFSNITNKAYKFKSIPVAVVYEKEDASFKSVLETVAEDDSQGEKFLKVTETNLEEAKKLLNDKEIEVVIKVNDSIDMMVAKTGLNQTAVKSFIQQYNLKANMVKDILESHPEKMAEVSKSLMSTAETVLNKELTAAKVDSFSTYYFSLIAMTLLFGGMFGMQCAREMNANTSDVGMRKCISPAKRGRLIIAEVFANYILHLIIMAILLVYMVFAMKIDLGDQIGYIALVCVVGSAVGISIGMFLGSLSKIREGVQDALFVILSLCSCFLSGLMMPDIKSFIVHNVPIVAKINPASLIEDSLYSLLVYDTHERFFGNLIILAGIAVVFCLLSFLLTRRKSYASI